MAREVIQVREYTSSVECYWLTLCHAQEKFTGTFVLHLERHLVHNTKTVIHKVVLAENI